MIDGIKSGKGRGETREKLKLDEEPDFRPPEEVAAEDSFDEPDVDVTEKPKFTGEPKKPQRRNPVVWFQDLSKKQKIIAIAVIIILLGGGGALAYRQLNKPAPVVSAPVVEEKKPEEPVKKIIYSPLTGVPVTEEQSKLPVTGVMIENSPDARPQSGLHKAGVVFEAIAEGGITRFLALYQEEQPDYIGPIRSARPYYVDWLQGFDAAIAHVGGSWEALSKIKKEGVKDLDQFANGGAFRRVSNRYAPHNMYSSLGELTNLQRSKGWNTSTFTGFPRKAEKPSSALTARAIDITTSGSRYNVHYDYDAASNSYKRVLAGLPHVDERSKQQITPKVVIALVIPYSIHADGLHSVYQTIGSGKAFIFQDGIVTEATWEKPAPKTQITFKDAAGKPVELNAGQTWITATSIVNNVTYKP